MFKSLKIIYLYQKRTLEITHIINNRQNITDIYIFFTFFFVYIYIFSFSGSSIEFCLNFQVLFYLMLPGLFIGMASRDRWLGIFKTLLPHLVCLSWWQMAIIASKGQFIIKGKVSYIIFIIFYLKTLNVDKSLDHFTFY